MQRWCYFVLLVILSKSSYGRAIDSTLNLAFYNDVYYQDDFNTRNSLQRYPFLFNHNRTNSIAINQALLLLSYQSKNIRGNMGLQAGTYPNDNYGPDSNYKYVYEANAGFTLDKNKKWWIDVGILPSYLGFESAISSKNLTLSRSLCAENSPYYLTGIFTTFNPNENWSFKMAINNGWQRIIKTPEQHMGYGAQIQYKKNNFLFNYGNFLGNQSALKNTDSFRFFNNAFVQLDGAKGSFILGVDYGIERVHRNGISAIAHWYNATLIKQFNLHKKLNISGRLEYFSDVYELHINNFSTGETLGASINLDFKPTKAVLLRIEPKTLFASRYKLHRAGTTFYPVPSILVSCAVAIE